MKLVEILDRIKSENGIESNGELARFLGTDTRRIGEYYAGKRPPTDDDYAKIATAAHINAGELWEAVQLERKKDGEAARAWENYMKRLGGIAASFATGIVVLVTLLVTPYPAEAAPLHVYMTNTFCIMLSLIAISQLQSILSRVRQKCTFGMNTARIAQIAT